MDPVVGAAAKAAGAIAAEGNKATPGLVARMLGPAADEIGAALGRYTGRQLSNVGRVAEAAERKRVRSGADQNEDVGLRSAMRIVEDASYSEGPVVAEYLSGVLASAKSEGSQDDRAVGWSSLVSRMSSDQLRLHFVFYSAFRHTLLGRQDETASELCTASCFIPYSVILQGMGWETGEDWERFYDAFYGLVREGLLEANRWRYGNATSLGELDPSADFGSGGLVASPSRPGLGLWLWGMGYGAANVTEAVRPDLDMQPVLVDFDFDLADVALMSDLPRLEAKPGSGSSPV